MTTNELIKLVLDRDAKATTAHYRTAAPLLARKLQRAMEELRRFGTPNANRWVEIESQEALDEIEAME